MARRSEQIGKLITKEISELLEREVNDPRLRNDLISITGASVSPDLKYAKVFVSILGGETNKRDMLAGLNSASGFLRKELSSHLRLRYIPQLSFHYDNSIERGARLLNLIEQASDIKQRND
jgi:ribosome-binding factor A